MTKELHIGAYRVSLYFPSQIVPQDYEGLGLYRLMQEGYGFSTGLHDQAAMEYGGNDSERSIYWVRRDGQVVGTLTADFAHRPPLELEKGINFLGHLREISPAVADLCQQETICSIGGVVLLPELRGQGIAQALLSTFVEDAQPILVTGRTKTPQAVLMRSRVLARLGYRTWYGKVEVTPDAELPPAELPHAAVFTAYLKHRGHAYIDGVTYTTPDILLSTVPDVVTMPSVIQEAFAPVIAAQERQNLLAETEIKTATLPLISIRVK